MTTKKLTRRQARWSLELSEYDFSLTHRPGKLNGRADSLSRREDYKSNTESSNFQRILGSVKDFLAGEDNVWMDDVPEVILERCKRELKHFRFRDNSFLRILEDGKSTAAYVTTDKRVDVMKHYHTSLAHLKYGSIIDLLLRRFWWPSMKKGLEGFHCTMSRVSIGTSDSNTCCYWILSFLSSVSEFILVFQLTRLLRETLWHLLTKSNGWRRTPNSLLENLEEVGQARSAANVRTKAQSEAMRKRGGFDENTPDYFFKVGDMVQDEAPRKAQA
ncbi:hypothetical protein BASA81_011192 [Batrachochytrium salamandrivorans]|nr:hypothetical protein BASA81_011192 [Batrachochytrium salamandrivorans]